MATPRPRIIPFFILACLFSWFDWALVMASERGWIPFDIGLNPWGSFGPAVAAIAVTIAVAGWRGVRELFRPLWRWRFGFAWWAVVVLGPAAMVALATVLHASTGGPVGPPARPDGAQLALMMALLFVFGGPLGEEIGWRGYALPHLLGRMGPVPGSLVIAAMWSVWHLPLFWLPGTTQEGSSVVLFTGLVTAASVLTTWVYLGTGRSLLAAMVFHHSINMSTYFLPSVFPGLESTQGVDQMLLVIMGLAAAVAGWWMWRVPSRGTHERILQRVR